MAPVTKNVDVRLRQPDVLSPPTPSAARCKDAPAVRSKDKTPAQGRMTPMRPEVSPGAGRTAHDERARSL